MHATRPFSHKRGDALLNIVLGCILLLALLTALVIA